MLSRQIARSARSAANSTKNLKLRSVQASARVSCRPVTTVARWSGVAASPAYTPRSRCAIAFPQARNFSSEAPPLFEKILIANRGEIACRIARTAKKMGIKTVAVYSDADSRAVHVKECDEAIYIGGSPAIESYLDIDRIVEAMKVSGATAVHPGYGFLSENASFVERLEKEGLTFIGPKTLAIQSMGDKIESKTIAMNAGVSTIPGQLGLIEDEAGAVKVSKEIGYPVMIKASAGGGGKGMRVAHNDTEAAEGFRLAKAEAAASFGDDRIFIEKFVDRPRHIEIQIIADSHGNCIYLPERECSIQRRNQKVIEEAPSPFIDEVTWRKMGEQACALAKAVKYQSAGTVEMMVDGDKNFYFLEMNTRLQVEHPVTELVTGLDLVELMIKVAAGEKLPIKQENIKACGWAMESRIYAEDSLRSFLPSVGVLHRYVPPVNHEGVRIDTGVEEGSDISIFYDPMIAKLITYGKDREEAIGRMKKALDEYVIKGVVSNINFVRDVMDNDRFISGDLTTHFIDQEYPAPGFRGHLLTESEGKELSGIAAMLYMQHFQQAKVYLSTSGSKVAGKDTVGSAALLSVMSTDTIISKKELIVTMEGTVGEPVQKKVQIACHRPELGDVYSTSFDISIDGAAPITFSARLPANSGLYAATTSDSATKVEKTQTVQLVERTNAGYVLSMSGTPYKITVWTERLEQLSKIMIKKEATDRSNELRTPMPGKVHSIAVTEGEEVLAGQEMCVVEAMKMQNVLRSPKDGVVKKIHPQIGQNLNLEDLIMEFD